VTQERPAASDIRETLTRGFLFADLRGYTAFLDRQGAIAAATLLARFRDLVRTIVAAHRGAEIRTEGDSFYVVFPSASSAVAAALAIAAAARDDASNPGDTIQVGLGVHAGEAVDTPEGPVGTAVNIAARLCAQAQPGEVIVSDTVRSLTRSIGDAVFVPLGRRRLKGLDEPMALYRAVAAGTPVARRRRPGRVAPAVAAVAVMSTATLALAVLLGPPAPGSSESSRGSGASGTGGGSAALSDEPSSTRRPIGYEETTRFAVPFTMALGSGWLRDNSERPDLVSFLRRTQPSGFIDVLIVKAVLDPPCPDVPPTFIGDRPEDVIEWVATRPWLDHDAPRPHNLGPYLGRAVAFDMPARARWTCPVANAPGTATMFRLGASSIEAIGGAWKARATQRTFLVAVDAGGRTVAIAVSSFDDDADEFLALAVPLLQSIRFTGADR